MEWKHVISSPTTTPMILPVLPILSTDTLLDTNSSTQMDVGQRGSSDKAPMFVGNDGLCWPNYSLFLWRFQAYTVHHNPTTAFHSFLCGLSVLSMFERMSNRRFPKAAPYCFWWPSSICSSIYSSVDGLHASFATVTTSRSITRWHVILLWNSKPWPYIMVIVIFHKIIVVRVCSHWWICNYEGRMRII